MINSIEINPLTESAYYILLSLYTPRHGYGIMQNISQLTSDRINMGPGTLYGAIINLIEKGWIKLVLEDGRKKEYQITQLGIEIMKNEIDRLKELVNNGDKILKGEINNV